MGQIWRNYGLHFCDFLDGTSSAPLTGDRKCLIKLFGVTVKSWMHISDSSGTLAGMLHFLLPRVN